jgi:ADP-ribosylglycohydrolase
MKVFITTHKSYISFNRWIDMLTKRRLLVLQRTMTKIVILGLIQLWCLIGHCFGQERQSISQEELRDKIEAYWYGQLVGNYMGFPFENVYKEEPIPILIDRYFTVEDLTTHDLKMNADDRRAYGHIMADAMGGAWSDDDTDIEFVTLHAVEKYGLDLNYLEITEMWKAHINRFIWAANRQARDLMDTGLLPPETGSKKNNPYWYRITSQLVNEIWSVFYPGMTSQAQSRAEWGARIMCDDWAVHATMAYAIMYSAAFFEKDVDKLVTMAATSLPENSPYKRGMFDVIKWHKQFDDWRMTRKLIHQNYYTYVDDFKVPDPFVSSVVNGLSSIMAIMYGEGDFLKTVSISVSAGYDCDNQAATGGGLLGIINGTAGIPKELLLDLPSRDKWKVPFNNTYINYSRDNLPNFNRISDIVDRILNISEIAILQNQGSKFEKDGKIIYEIVTR